jgi:hypothetical protein
MSNDNRERDQLTDHKEFQPLLNIISATVRKKNQQIVIPAGSRVDWTPQQHMGPLALTQTN